MAKAKKNPVYKNFRATIYTEEGDMMTYPVYDIAGDMIELDNQILKISDAQRYYDHNVDGIHYIFNLDLPAKVEAEELKKLRRSTAINNLFKYESKKGLDLMTLLPWLVIVLMVLFK
jgi:hypothetical protein